MISPSPMHAARSDSAMEELNRIRVLYVACFACWMDTALSVSITIESVVNGRLASLEN